MENETFKVGEIAILQNLPVPFTVFHGQECEIIAALALTDIVDIFGVHDTAVVYQISHRGLIVAVRPNSLKKRPSKGDDAEESKDTDFGKTVEWKDCAWSPESVEA